jgi:hypothetical protein
MIDITGIDRFTLIRELARAMPIEQAFPMRCPRGCGHVHAGLDPCGHVDELTDVVCGCVVTADELTITDADAAAAITPEALARCGFEPVWVKERKVYAFIVDGQLDDRTFDRKAESPGLAAMVVAVLREAAP